ncbi:NifB/NifX family molybdenum-iron cluster-binding protein [Breznakiellaceae bacterium SP9]
MAWRIAATSADGVLINQHFGHAKWFYIIDVKSDGTSVVAEKRDVTPWCQNQHEGDVRQRDSAAGDGGIAREIRDCIAVLTAMIGGPARKKLELAGIAVFEEPAPLEEAVKKLAAYYVKTKRPENRA